MATGKQVTVRAEHRPSGGTADVQMYVCDVGYRETAFWEARAAFARLEPSGEWHSPEIFEANDCGLPKAEWTYIPPTL
jgi:hypothetical protein